VNRILGLVTTLLLGSLSFAHAHSVTVGEMEIVHPAIPAPPAAARSAAGYLEIVNAGSVGDRLLGVETAIAKQAMLHSTDHGADGVARMVHLDAIDIPANGTVLLEPGGMHIMLMGLKKPLKVGDTFPMQLRFRKAGKVQITVRVVEISAASKSDRGDDMHKHHHHHQ
jgi:copper(I)-binding protein